MKKQTPNQKYRERLRKMGFRYVSVWIHESDLKELRFLAERSKIRRLTKFIESITTRQIGGHASKAFKNKAFDQ